VNNIIPFPKKYRENPFILNWVKFFETNGLPFLSANIIPFVAHKSRLTPSIIIKTALETIDKNWDTNINSLSQNPQKKLLECDKHAILFGISWTKINPVPNTIREQILKIINPEDKNDQP
jgi:hypothetical protein